MVAKTKKRPAVVKAAFDRFIELVRPIEGVAYVVLPDGGPPEVFTYIESRDQELSYAVIRAENAVIREFMDIEIDFHIRFLQSRELGVVAPSSGLTFIRATDA